MANNVYYFSHDSNARNDEKVMMLRAEHGLEGYGAFWMLAEMMFENSDSRLSHSKVKGIAVSNNIDITVLSNIIQTCIEEGLFESDGEYFWSNSLIRRKERFYELREKRSEAGVKGMEKRWGKAKVYQTDNTVITKNNKGKERKGNKSKVNNTTKQFDIFWKAYPKKVAKGQAERAFEKLKPDESLMKIISSAVENQKKSEQWLKDGGQFVPHAATWLNGKRWEDEVKPSPIGKKCRVVN
jgi:hypothetical protein